MAAFDQLTSWPVPFAAAGVANATGPIADAGAAGLAQEWASVTKLVTAYGVLRLVDRGDLELDEPAGPPGSTVRHLLAHASGLGFEGHTVLASPARRRIYSNTGFDLLGTLVEERTGQPVGRYLADTILGPLGMADSAITGTPSAGGRGSVRDLLKFAAELLAPTLVSRQLVTQATTVAFAGLGGILPGFGRCDPNDWGLGFELRDGKQPHWTGRANSASTFGHFGQSGSFLWVDPDAGLACAVLTGEPFGPWAKEAWPPFSDAVLAEYSGLRGNNSLLEG